MTTRFTPFQFQELSPKKQPEKSANGVSEFEAPSFQAHPSQNTLRFGKEGAKDKTQHFRLDKTVVSQLGIEEEERVLMEARIQKEIDRRWDLVKEKAEVEGYTAGLEEGKKEAYRAELPRATEKIERFDELMQSIDSMREQIFLSNETFLMDLIAQITRMIVLKEIELDKDYIHRVVLSLIKQLGAKDDIKIFISPEDMKLVDSLKNAVEKEFGKLSNTSFEVGKDLANGGCKIETRSGVVDASLQVQIENVMKALKV